jgi:hypothetical protein
VSIDIRAFNQDNGPLFQQQMRAAFPGATLRWPTEFYAPANVVPVRKCRVSGWDNRFLAHLTYPFFHAIS